MSGPTTNAGFRERWQHALMDNYGTPALALVHGSGAEVWDADGRRYLSTSRCCAWPSACWSYWTRPTPG